MTFMTLTDRLRSDVRRLASGGDTPEFQAAFARFMAASERDRHPWWERATVWYMRLPHNRLLLWLGRYPMVTVPVGVAGLVVEVVLLRP
jgi:hypothetical protein